MKQHENAQIHRRDGRLKAALQDLEACESLLCPAEVRNDCQAWAGELRDEIPTVTVSLEPGPAPSGPLLLVVNGARQEIAALPFTMRMDPGESVIALQAEGLTTEPLSIVLSRGEHEEVRFSRVVAEESEPVPARAAQPKREARRLEPSPGGSPGDGVGWLVPSLAVVTIAGLGVGTWAAIDANALHRKARSECAPFCESDTRDRIATRAAVANVSFGVGAGAGLLLLWLLHDDSKEQSGGYRFSASAPSMDSMELKLDGSF